MLKSIFNKANWEVLSEFMKKHIIAKTAICEDSKYVRRQKSWHVNPFFSKISAVWTIS